MESKTNLFATFHNIAGCVKINPAEQAAA